VTTVEVERRCDGYGDVAQAYLDAGWNPLPIDPVCGKEGVPAGYTGAAGASVTQADVDKWCRQRPRYLVGLRMPDGVVGLDVDHYDKGEVVKRGAFHLAALEERHGPLPPTWTSTARGDTPSGIRFYRVPVGTRLRGEVCADVEVVQFHHRYAMVWPSTHPDLGTRYRWYDPAGEEADRVPALDDLAELPWPWLDELRGQHAAAQVTAPPATAERVKVFLTGHTAGTAGTLAKLEADLRRDDGSRHSRLVRHLLRAMRAARRGEVPAHDAAEMLHRWWLEVMNDPVRRDGPEFPNAVRWAVAQAEADPAEAVVGPNLPASFWQARPVLAHIRQAAHSRGRSADAVLGVVLARLAALTPPELVLPAIVGKRQTLNVIHAVVAPSGGGKSSAAGVAGEVLPWPLGYEVQALPVGSGEGLVESYMDLVTVDGKKEKRQTRDRLYFYLDEGQALAELGSRKGSTLLPTVRSAWSGEMLGQANATTDTRRVLREGAYRCAVVIGLQVAHGAALLDDAAGGTPQRVAFFAATDPTVPDDPPPWPGHLEVAVAQPGEMDVHPAIADEIRRHALALVRGEAEADPLDSHANLVRLKLAALLALLDDRHAIHPDDWQLAGDVWASSCAVRRHIAATAAQAAQAREEAYTARQVRTQHAVAASVEQRAVECMARAIARKARRRAPDTLTRRDLHGATKAAWRQHATLDDAIALAVEHGWISDAGDERWTVGKSTPA
jgi:hypothetical protein